MNFEHHFRHSGYLCTLSLAGGLDYAPGGQLVLMGSVDSRTTCPRTRCLGGHIRGGTSCTMQLVNLANTVRRLHHPSLEY